MGWILHLNGTGFSGTTSATEPSSLTEWLNRTLEFNKWFDNLNEYRCVSVLPTKIIATKRYYLIDKTKKKELPRTLEGLNQAIEFADLEQYIPLTEDSIKAKQIKLEQQIKAYSNELRELQKIRFSSSTP